MTVGPPRPARPLIRGDVVLVPFPFTDLSSTRLRPAVVVAATSQHEDVTLAFIGSQALDRVGQGDLLVHASHPEFALTGLSIPSKIRTAKIVTLNRVLVRRWLGRLGPLLTADLDHALVSALGVNLVPYREEGRLQERRRLLDLHRAGGPEAVVADLRGQPF